MSEAVVATPISPAARREAPSLRAWYFVVMALSLLFTAYVSFLPFHLKWIRSTDQPGNRPWALGPG